MVVMSKVRENQDDPFTSEDKFLYLLFGWIFVLGIIGHTLLGVFDRVTEQHNNKP